MGSEMCIRDSSIYSFVRRNESGKQHMLFVINMTPVEYPKYRVGVPMNTQYKLLLNSDDEKFGGNGNKIPKVLKAKKGLCDTREQYITFSLPPLTAAIFEF